MMQKFRLFRQNDRRAFQTAGNPLRKMSAQNAEYAASRGLPDRLLHKIIPATPAIAGTSVARRPVTPVVLITPIFSGKRGCATINAEMTNSMMIVADVQTNARASRMRMTFH